MKRHFLRGEAHSRFDDARLDAIERLGTVAKDRGCAFIVVAGDVFEANSLYPQTLARALDVLGQLPVPVFLLPGNHDPLVSGAILERADELPGVTVLRDSTPVPVPHLPGVEVVGAPLVTRHPSSDLVGEALAGLEPTSGIRIMVGHSQVEHRGSAAPACIDLDRVVSALDSGVIDYLALGDTHSTRSLEPRGRVWFSGTPETTDFHLHDTPGGGEVDSGNVLAVEISKARATDAEVQVERVPVGQWHFEGYSFEVDSPEAADAAIETVAAWPDKRRTVVKYRVSGAVDLATFRRFKTGMDDAARPFAAVYERDSSPGLHLVPNLENLEALGITGFAAGAVRTLAASSTTEAQDALALLFRLSQEANQ